MTSSKNINNTINWTNALSPLFKIYSKRKHPLQYKNTYQLLVMIILSAQTTDALINSIATELFRKFPSIRELAKTSPEDLYPYIKTVRGYRKKADWLVRIAKELKDDKNIPLEIDQLVKLPGIGRKSANVIIREAGGPPQGIFVDLHVLRVVERIGITKEKKPDKVERELMNKIKKEHWHDTGISFSYLGREICRPTNPECKKCPINSICYYYKAKPPT